MIKKGTGAICHKVAEVRALNVLIFHREYRPEMHNHANRWVQPLGLAQISHR